MYNVMWWTLVVLMAFSQIIRLGELMGIENERKSLHDADPMLRLILLILSAPFWYYTWIIFLNAKH